MMPGFDGSEAWEAASSCLLQAARGLRAPPVWMDAQTVYAYSICYKVYILYMLYMLYTLYKADARTPTQCFPTEAASQGRK